jgi:hypothetical protein
MRSDTRDIPILCAQNSNDKNNTCRRTTPAEKPADKHDKPK